MPPKKGNNKKALSKKKKPVVLVETESDSSSVDEVDDETGEDGESKFLLRGGIKKLERTCLISTLCNFSNP